MGGTVKSIVSNPVKSIGQGLGDVFTGGLSAIAPNSAIGRVGQDVGSSLTGMSSPLVNPLTGAPMFGGSTGNPNISGPFSLNAAQMAGDMGAINALGTTQQQQTGDLGQKQYDQTLSQIPSDVSNAIAQENPQIMENLNSSGLLTSSAYPQEIARQQSYLTQNLAIPAMQALQKSQQGGLGQLQGANTAATQRGISMEDFINQANVAKTIGAQMAPQPPSSKAQAGTVMQGIGAIGQPLATYAAGK